VIGWLSENGGTAIASALAVRVNIVDIDEVREVAHAGSATARVPNSAISGPIKTTPSPVES
jgi:hypothetical protein